MFQKGDGAGVVDFENEFQLCFGRLLILVPLPDNLEDLLQK